MYTYETRLGIDHSGPDGKQTVVSVLDIMQNCSQFWLESEPGLASYMRQHNMALFLASRQLDVYHLAEYGERLTVQTSIYECKDYYGYRNTAVYGADGAPYAKSWCQGVFVSLATGKPVKITPELLASITFDEKLAMEYLPRKVRLPAEGFAALAAIRPSPFDIDFNRHVNNVRYVQMACECLPGFGRYNRLRIEHKATAQLQDEITPRVCQTPAAAYVCLEKQGGVPCCTVEFTAM